MASYFLRIDKYFPYFFIFRSCGDEFRSIFGDILSYLSSNIGNEGKTFNSSCNTEHRRNNFESDDCKRLCYFLPSTYYNYCYSFLSCNVIYQLQAVSSRQEKSKNQKNFTRYKKDVVFEKYIELFASSRLWCGAVVASTPGFVYIGLRINSPETAYTLNNANLAGMWTITISLMNGTFNCLIFYWKNKVLRTEGLKVLKSLKICRRVDS